MRIIILLTFLFGVTIQAQTKLNPEISLNTLLAVRYGSGGNSLLSERQNGFRLQEAELRLTSNIDAYFRGDVMLAVEQEDPETPGEEGEFAVEPEEIFVETISLDDITIRVGKFFAYWGRTNQWHSHRFSFVDANLTRELFGEEGFNEVGLSVSYLLPAPWYFELVVQAFSANNEAVFGSSAQDDLSGVYFIKNLWDLSESSTFELDLSYGHGADQTDKTNSIYNAALTYKKRWSDQRSITFTTEFTYADRTFDETTNSGKTSALSSWVELQVAKRWWLQGRYEFLSKNIIDDDLQKSSALIGFLPTEYSGLRLQYDYIKSPVSVEDEQRVTLQLNFSMGAHPAHDY